MTQEERWFQQYNEVKNVIETNKRNPSKYEPTERGMLNWQKQQRKLINAGALKQDRVELFNELQVLVEKYRHVNHICIREYEETI